LDGEYHYESGGGKGRERDPAEVRRRRIRVERLEDDTETRRTASSSKMTSASHAMLPSSRSTPSHRRRGHRHESPERVSHSRRKSGPREEPTTYVYGTPKDKKRSSRIIVTETRRLGRDGESTEEEEERATKSEPVKEKRVKVIYVSAAEAKTLKHKERSSRTTKELSERPRHSEESVHRSRAHRSRQNSVSQAPPSPPKRFAFCKIQVVAKANTFFQERFNKVPTIKFPPFNQEKQYNQFSYEI
jgi:hypothetical protein